MLDPIEREGWFASFLTHALMHQAARADRQRAEKWARSMSLIAEQFTDRYSGEPVDA